MIRVFLLLLFVMPIGCSTKADRSDSNFARGVDVSLLPHLEDRGITFRDNGRPDDALRVFKRHGVNYVRLRLFVDPDGTIGQVNTLPYTLALAKRVKRVGLQFLLDLHYSDHWADPKSQHIPKAWRGLDQPQLVTQVREYTRQTLLAFHDDGCAPDMVQVGNEIANGMLWPNGGSLDDAKKWEPFAELVQAGIAGVHDAAAVTGEKAPPIMIHAHAGDDETVCRWFFDNLRQRGVRWDIIGL